jgi:hypothetical protein
MPVYQVTAPDGRKLRITAPEGATQEQALAYAQQQLGQAGGQQGGGESKQQKYERLLAENEARQPSDPMHPSNNPTTGMSAFGKGAAAAGKSLADTWQGIEQIYAAVADKVAPRQRTTADLITGRDPSRSAEVQRQVQRDRELDAPLMATGAGQVGNIVGQGLQMAVPVPAAAALKATSWAGKGAPYLAAATRAGIFGALQPAANGESRAGRAAQSAMLGVAGQGIASASGALARGAARRLDPYARNLAGKAQQLGIKLGVPSMSENPLIRTAASQMERLPFSGAGKRFRQNQEAVNRAVGREIGIPNAKRITPDIFADAKTRIGGEFNRLASRNTLDLNTQHIADVRSVVDEAGRLGGKDLGEQLRNWANDLISRVDASGKIPGAAYKSFDSKIGKAMASGGEKAHYLGQLREVVRDAMDSSISASDRQAWKLARQQWAALKTVEPLVAKSANGNIPPSQLMGRVTADGAGKSRMAAGGGGNLGDLARIGQRFLKDAPNSGTADRMMVNAAIGGGLYGAQNFGLIDPSTAMLVGGGLLANRAALGALNSRALSAGGSAPLTGLARLLQTSPRLLPAASSQPPLALDIVGGTPGPAPTPDEMAKLRARAAAARN